MKELKKLAQKYKFYLFHPTLCVVFEIGDHENYLTKKKLAFDFFLMLWLNYKDFLF